MTDLDELIAEAKSRMKGEINMPGRVFLSGVINALEVAGAERDAALAAVERGRNVLELLRNYAEDSICTTHGMLSASFVKEHVEIALAALDGAPEPEEKP